jgi:hypothetical protein
MAPNVKLSAPVPPLRFSIPVNALVPLASLSVPAFAALIDQVLVRSLPVSVSVPVPPSIVPLTFPVALSVKLSAPEPPVRFSTCVKVVLVLSEPAFDALINHVLVPSVAASVSVPPPPAIEPLKVVTVLCSVKLS